MGGGWGPGLAFDRSGGYQPDFAIGMALNLLDRAIVPFLVARQRSPGARSVAA